MLKRDCLETCTTNVGSTSLELLLETKAIIYYFDLDTRLERNKNCKKKIPSHQKISSIKSLKQIFLQAITVLK